MVRKLLAVLLALTPCYAFAQADTQIETPDTTYGIISSSNMRVTPTGGTQQKLGDALANSSGSSVTPTGAPTALPLPTIASQQGVLLDAFKLPADPDDTASMTRAVAAGVPILLGPKTYTVNNYAMAGTPANFVLIGVPGKSIIQRTNGTGGSQFFAISAANVVIDGVIFDMNRASVSANQWGVFMNTGGQNIQIRHAGFKNNSGSLGVGLAILATQTNDGGTYNISDNEFANNSAPIGGALYLGTASHGIVTRNYIHDNGGHGIFAQSNGTATLTNYITDVIISHNRVERNLLNGISVGGFAPPYSFTIPPATQIFVDDNQLVDNVLYGILLEGDHLSASLNRVYQTSLPFTASFATSVMTVTVAPINGAIAVGMPISGTGIARGTVVSSLGTGTGGIGTYNLSTSPGTISAQDTTAWTAVYGGINVSGTNSNVIGNDVTIMNEPWGIDVGGSWYSNVRDNSVTMNQGTALNIGSNLNSAATNNHLIVSGSAQAVVVQAIDQGGNATFPTAASGIAIDANTIDITGSAATGIKLLDGAGGYPGTTAMLVRRNIFNVTGSGSNPNQDILWYGPAGSAVIDGNIHNGVNKLFIDPNGGGDVVFPLVYFGGQVSNISSTANVRSIITTDISNYIGNGTIGPSVLYVIPSAGGSGYTAATVMVFSGTNCTGQAANAEIISGVIVGVKMTNFGTGCTGTVTVSASDSGGGSGATFTVGNIPHLPTGSTLSFIGNTNFLLQRNGGIISLTLPRAIPMNSGSTVQLVALSSNTWNVLAATQGTFATAALPTCNATSLNAWAYANDALTPTYGATLTGGGAVLSPVVCNGTNWLTH